MLIKTDQSRYQDLEQAIISLHPYELPEIIAVPVEQGLAGYLNWVDTMHNKFLRHYPFNTTDTFRCFFHSLHRQRGFSPA